MRRSTATPLPLVGTAHSDMQPVSTRPEVHRFAESRSSASSDGRRPSTDRGRQERPCWRRRAYLPTSTESLSQDQCVVRRRRTPADLLPLVGAEHPNCVRVVRLRRAAGAPGPLNRRPVHRRSRSSGRGWGPAKSEPPSSSVRQQPVAAEPGPSRPSSFGAIRTPARRAAGSLEGLARHRSRAEVPCAAHRRCAIASRSGRR